MDTDRDWNKDMSEIAAIIIIVGMICMLAGLGVYNNYQDKKHLKFRKSRKDLNPEFWEDS